MNGPLPLSTWDLVLSSLLLVVTGAISVGLSLGLGRRLAIAAARTVLQLTLIGLVLHWVFALDCWWMVLAVATSMIINAGIAAVQRVESRFAGIYSSGLLAVSVSSVLVTAVVTELVVGVSPWYAPRYVIPLLGMVLGNSLTGISLALDRLLNDLRTRSAEVEARLALGATAWEATRPLLADALRMGMVPMLNAMSVAGIVSLPGMMTGQILAGASPVEAVKYQIVVMFMVTSGTGLGALLACLSSYRRLVTRRHQLALYRLSRT